MDEKFDDVNWLTDRDSRIGDNPDQIRDTEKILMRVFNFFELKYNNVFLYLQEDNLHDEELNSIVDLASGCLLDTFDSPENVKDFSYEYFKWFSNKSSNLKKRCFVMSEEARNPRIVELLHKV
ncbi:MAG: hypothetical protein IPJ00_04980 [Saprospirales bacterium]|nr:hypothetical protein [Saprospirales bacterium]